MLDSNIKHAWVRYYLMTGYNDIDERVAINPK